MDDVAKELGMSKKTIYQCVENKAELVHLTLKNYLDEERITLESIMKESDNSIDEMIQMISYFFNQVRDFDTTSMNDLKKYYHETWKMYLEYRYQFLQKLFTENLQRGIRQGVYRKDLNAVIIARMHISAVDVMFDQQVFPPRQFVFLNVYKEYLHYHLRGIVSPKGMKVLEQHNFLKEH